MQDVGAQRAAANQHPPIRKPLVEAQAGAQLYQLGVEVREAAVSSLRIRVAISIEVQELPGRKLQLLQVLRELGEAVTAVRASTSPPCRPTCVISMMINFQARIDGEEVGTALRADEYGGEDFAEWYTLY